MVNRNKLGDTLKYIFIRRGRRQNRGQSLRCSLDSRLLSTYKDNENRAHEALFCHNAVAK
jgi:hypothetical protein